jgi:hypothetical protein
VRIISSKTAPTKSKNKLEINCRNELVYVHPLR